MRTDNFAGATIESRLSRKTLDGPAIDCNCSPGAVVISALYLWNEKTLRMRSELVLAYVCVCVCAFRCWGSLCAVTATAAANVIIVIRIYSRDAPTRATSTSLGNTRRVGRSHSVFVVGELLCVSTLSPEKVNKLHFILNFEYSFI